MKQTHGPPPPIVGLGASAGGLRAFEEFFSSIPAFPKPEMAFVLVQHLAADHKSLLPQLIQQYTSLFVFEVEDGMRVEANAVYVIPPGHDVVLSEGYLRLKADNSRSPIDTFFRSLAEQLRHEAIGILLSGTGSDGTDGARALKEGGGWVLAQDPDSAEYAGLPQSAIEGGWVDAVLAPQDMPAWLAEHRGAAQPAGSFRPAPSTSPEDAEALHELFGLVEARTGRDFSRYKEPSIRRRLERRMSQHGLDTISDYVRILREDPEEIEVLAGDLLIGVTQFFRDSPALSKLAQAVFPRLFQELPPRSALRLWVPACSTGEEAYSIAILLREYMAASEQARAVQIFATDIDPGAVAVARAGIYPTSIAEAVSEERLDRFFRSEDGGRSHRVRSNIRDMIVFSEHDVLTDPPFSRMSLISCRNLLIYLVPDSQQKLIHLLHYALNPGGFLVLGTSESLGDAADRFDVVDRETKLFVAKEAPPSGPGPGPFIRPVPGARAGAFGQAPESHRGSRKRPLRELTERELLAHEVPSAALVDAAGEILYLHGRTGRYLEPAAGEVGMNILGMAREGLQRGLTNALHQATRTREQVRPPTLRVRTNGDSTYVQVTVWPVETPSVLAAHGDLFLVTLQPVQVATPDAKPANAGGSELEQTEFGAAASARIAALEQESQSSETYVKALEEQMQAAAEAYRATIEELQSTNEELQSSNEELQTSKEELQSVSEELTTINAELEAKVEELTRIENDMNNLMAATGIGTIFLDLDLRIQRFTPAATELLNMIPEDIGRPIGDLTSRLEAYHDLARDAGKVLETLVPQDMEVHADDGPWYLLRIRPYRTLNNVIDGVVITFTNISEVHEARVKLRESAGLRRLAVIVEDSHDAITVQDLDGRLRAWNPAAERLYGWPEEEALEMLFHELVPSEERGDLQTTLQRVADGHPVEARRSRRVAKDGRELRVWMTATPLLAADDSVYAIAMTERPLDSTAENTA